MIGIGLAGSRRCQRLLHDEAIDVASKYVFGEQNFMVRNNT
jgi:hypothetical protein